MLILCLILSMTCWGHDPDDTDDPDDPDDPAAAAAAAVAAVAAVGTVAVVLLLSERTSGVSPVIFIFFIKFCCCLIGCKTCLKEAGQFVSDNAGLIWSVLQLSDIFPLIFFDRPWHAALFWPTSVQNLTTISIFFYTSFSRLSNMFPEELLVLQENTKPV